MNNEKYLLVTIQIYNCKAEGCRLPLHGEQVMFFAKGEWFFGLFEVIAFDSLGVKVPVFRYGVDNLYFTVSEIDYWHYPYPLDEENE